MSPDRGQEQSSTVYRLDDDVVLSDTLIFDASVIVFNKITILMIHTCSLLML